MANHVLLETIELTQSASSVTFDNIPQSGYTHLKVVVSSRTNTTTGAWDNVYITFNGTSSGYSQRIIYGNGSAVQSDTGSSTSIRTVYSNTATQGSNYLSANEIYIPNYLSSNNKIALMDSAVEQNTTTGHLSMASALWENTNAITSITLAPPANTFSVGSTFSLYGIAASGTTPALAPKADGGDIVANDGTYWYHAFLSSGTFIPQASITCDYLVVGGGGGGGSNAGGGGGAGGLRLATLQNLSEIPYTVVVGAGGMYGATNGYYIATNGTASSINSYSASGGGRGAMNGVVGNSGGSGGGGAGSGYAGGSGNSGSYSPVEGYAGGTGVSFAGGGGGGAGAAGSNASGSSTAGAGGAGTNSYNSTTFTNWLTATTTGVSGYLAGGGGGGSEGGTKGNGGSGGGGAGGQSNANGTAGTINTGSGGGGGSNGGSVYGGLGASGLVIIRYTIA